MVTKVLTDAQRFKIDQEPAHIFYQHPRFVQHLDKPFRTRLTEFYREQIPPCATVLDLGSSWVSHLPDNVRYERIIGHGMNDAELSANPRLDSYFVQDFNLDPSIPLQEGFVDVCMVVAAWQYWTRPEEVAAEMLRVTGRTGPRSWPSPTACFLLKLRRSGPTAMIVSTLTTSAPFFNRTDGVM